MVNSIVFNVVAVLWIVASVFWFYKYIQATNDLNSGSSLRVGLKFGSIYSAVSAVYLYFIYWIKYNDFRTILLGVISLYFVIGIIGGFILALITKLIRSLRSKGK
jgi:ABC-type Co2+ transport system permease subunit